MHRPIGAVHRIIALLVLISSLAAASGCYRVGVGQRDPSEYWREMQRSAITSDSLSERTIQYLKLVDLARFYPGSLYRLAERISAFAVETGEKDAVFAAAEVNYLAASRRESTNPTSADRYSFEALCFSWRYMFGAAKAAESSAFDPRARLCGEIYNRSLTRLVSDEAGKGVSASELFSSPTFSGMNIKVEYKGSLWADSDIEHLLLSARYEVKGIRNTYRTYGLGVPLIAVRSRREGEAGWRKHLPPGLAAFPVTAFLRIEGPEECPSLDKTFTVELVDTLRLSHTVVGGVTVPLESDITTPLAYCLSHYDPTSIGLGGFFDVEEWDSLAGLYMLEPYDPAKIPVVFIHGIVSSPMAWMEMFNDLRGDPELRSRYQFWFFMYPTGYPFTYSGALLRKALTTIRADLDPDGADSALDNMVLVGHSMGGLLVRLQVTDPGEELWNAVSSKPASELKVAPDIRKLIGDVFLYEPLPFVKKTIFLATPHKGSKIADIGIVRLVGKLVTLPATIVAQLARVIQDNPAAFAEQALTGEVPTSVYDLSSRNPLLLRLSELPASSGVESHSIIGNISDGPKEEWTDRVVPYWSSHRDDVVSELVMDSTHGCQDHPLAAREVMRILREWRPAGKGVR